MGSAYRYGNDEPCSHHRSGSETQGQYSTVIISHKVNTNQWNHILEVQGIEKKKCFLKKLHHPTNTNNIQADFQTKLRACVNQR